MDEMLTTKEAAERLGVTPRFVVSLCSRGRLRAWRFGRAWMVDPRSVEEYRIAPRHRGGRPRKVVGEIGEDAGAG